ncbi:GDP-mannose 4,6-dehydratase [Dehalobacter sp.]|uniref:GDP-mannose 4,6-dehydratase n=1 Tax=Dehalobacter sp. TaxID=1962289 RepID=UPI0025870E4C|nr:GDP-mannose 4,6-dehydratase [Dehalobacter sp.]MDJ0304955.1 GDP-mannose 4,6-dehydratase [Dehalobacter sp.]
MQTIVVTGGSGFIGSHLCERLLGEGNRVVNIDNFNDFYDPEIKYSNVSETKQYCIANGIPLKNYSVAKGDICDISFLKETFTKYCPQAVVHLAAYAGVRPSILSPELYVNVNINGTTNILQCLKEFGVKNFVFASSSSVYGNNKNVPFSENDPVDFPISPYAATKKAGELICYTYHHLYNINTACLRFFTVYGPRQRPDLAIHKFTQLIMDDKAIPFYGDGTTQRDYTYIADIIDGITKALDWVNNDEQRYGIFNLGESRTISLKDMVRTIEKALDRKAQFTIQPSQPGDVNRTFADISKSREILGYNPHTEFYQGIRYFVQWYKSTNNIK